MVREVVELVSDKDSTLLLNQLQEQQTHNWIAAYQKSNHRAFQWQHPTFQNLLPHYNM